MTGRRATLSAVKRGGNPVTTYSEFGANRTLRQRARQAVRNCAVFALSRLRTPPRGGSWIRFPTYHHVFDDERRQFETHLRFYRNYGEVLSIDDAIACLERPGPIDGRYFCLTFDDGFRNCLTNAAPLLVAHAALAAFFVPTHHVDEARARGAKPPPWLDHPPDREVEFLDWDDCRRLVAAGMTIGSHTATHARLSALSDAEAEHELRTSKQAIERELGTPCLHLCCPWGRRGIHFTDREPECARRLGYRSFLTSHPGRIGVKPPPFGVTRNAIHPTAGEYQLRYFFWR